MASKHYLIHLRICGSLKLKTSSVETEGSSLYAQENHGIFCKGSLQQKTHCFSSLFWPAWPSRMCLLNLWENPTQTLWVKGKKKKSTSHHVFCAKPHHIDMCNYGISWNTFLLEREVDEGYTGLWRASWKEYRIITKWPTEGGKKTTASNFRWQSKSELSNTYDKEGIHKQHVPAWVF